MEDYQGRIAELETRVAALEQALQQARQQAAVLQAVLSLSTQVFAASDLKATLTNIMRVAEQLTDAEASALLLYDEATDELFFEVATGEKGEAVKEVRLKRGEGIAGRVLQTGEPMLVPDAAKEPHHAKAVDAQTGFVTRNLIAVPLLLDGQPKGVLEVLNAHKGQFAPEDVTALQAMALLSAIAIDKAQTYQALHELFWDLVRIIVAALDARDPYTRGHSERVMHYAVAIAEEMGLSEEDRQRVALSALLHDIGKIGIPDGILLKEGHLTEVEFSIIKLHPEIGFRILQQSSRLRPYVDGVRYHHERLSGSGYPLGLKGDAIPLDARIIAVADMFDALTSQRPYRQAFSPAEAISLIRQQVPHELDETVFQALQRAWEKGNLASFLSRNPFVAPDRQETTEQGATGQSITQREAFNEAFPRGGAFSA